MNMYAGEQRNIGQVRKQGQLLPFIKVTLLVYNGRHILGALYVMVIRSQNDTPLGVAAFI